MKCVVITDSDIVSSIGSNQQEVLASLREERSRITFFQELKDPGIRSHIWSDVKLDIAGLTNREIVRFMNNTSIYALPSMEQVVADVDLAAEDYQNNPHADLIAGFGGGSLRFQMFGTDAMRSPRGLEAVGPCVVTKAMTSGVSTCLATPFKIHDVGYSINSACAASMHRIGNAIGRIQLGEQNTASTGDGEELCWEMACEFNAMGALSTRYGDAPEKASCTYDAHRDGFVIAGDGGMVVAKKLEHMLTYGAHIYARVVGYGATSGDADMAAPSGEGAVCCIQVAIYDVNTSIGYLDSHGTSTPVGDVRELGAIREVFGNNSPTIFATKTVTDHSLDAASVQEATYSLLMLEYGFIAPSINTEELDEQAAGLDIVTKPTEQALATVTSNSFGSSGTNATPVMCKLKA